MNINFVRQGRMLPIRVVSQSYDSTLNAFAQTLGFSESSSRLKVAANNTFIHFYLWMLSIIQEDKSYNKTYNLVSWTYCFSRPILDASSGQLIFCWSVTDPWRGRLTLETPRNLFDPKDSSTAHNWQNLKKSISVMILPLNLG